MLKWTVFLSFLLISFQTFSVEVCSRTATINYQDVLVDINSTQKGAGLKYYLEKDPIAKSYLERYQEGTRQLWPSATIGTTGSLMILSGLLVQDLSTSRDALLIGGSALLIINFLVAKTLEVGNEKYLIKSIDEYNKRNLPRIDFLPNDDKTSFKPTFSIKVVTDF